MEVKVRVGWLPDRFIYTEPSFCRDHQVVTRGGPVGFSSYPFVALYVHWDSGVVTHDGYVQVSLQLCDEALA